MCCFSGPVREVSRTRIFARAVTEAEQPGGSHRQHLVYSMRVVADDELAMILPLPTPAGVAEDDLTFVDLSSYPDLFRSLAAAFPAVQAKGGTPAPASRSFAPQTLVVHEVGDFDASFVPTIADFDRLDARFRLPPVVWDARPELGDASFAVFMLRAGGDHAAAGAASVSGDDARGPGIFGRVLGRRRSAPGGAGPHGDVHPMAFTFTRRDPSRLFFPTLHVHDGTLPARAAFDHELYWQGAPRAETDRDLDVASVESVAATVDAARARGLIDVTRPCYRWTIAGARANDDTYLPDLLPGGLPAGASA